MKKIYNILLVSAVLLTFISCEKSEQQGNNAELDGKVVLTATIEQSAGTRAIVEDNGLFRWGSDDVVAMYNADGQPINIDLRFINNGTSANFILDNTIDPGIAVFPPNPENHTLGSDHKLQNVTLPNVYDAYNPVVSESNTPRLNSPMVADFDSYVSGVINQDFEFKHLCGVMKISLAQVPAGVNQVVFTTTENGITGTFNVDYTTNAEPRITAATPVTEGDGKNNTVTFNFEAQEEGKDMAFYIPLPIGTYNAFSITLNKVEGSTVSTIAAKDAVTTGRKITRTKLALMPSPSFDFMLIDGIHYVYNAKGLMTVNDLVNNNNLKSAKITLVNDIVLPEVADGESNWTPISEYSGTFDGNGKSISGLVIRNTTYAGLFYNLSGTVKDLKIINPFLEGTNGCAVIDANQTSRSSIINCHIEGGSITSGNTAGGIVYNNNLFSNIIGCSVSNTTIKANGNFVGGIAGMNTRFGNIIACYSLNNIIISYSNNSSKSEGGLVGSNMSSTKIGLPSNVSGAAIGIIYGCFSEGCKYGETETAFDGLANLSGRHTYGGADYNGDPITYKSYYKQNGKFYCVDGAGTAVKVISETTVWSEAAGIMNEVIEDSGSTQYKWDTSEIKLVPNN